MSQYKLLMILQHEPQVHQRVIAERLGQTEASVSRQVKLLCAKGMLAVKINPDNKREHLTIATVKGVKVAEAARDILAEYYEEVLGDSGLRQQRQLYETLEHVHSAACPPNKPHECGPPFVSLNYIDAIAASRDIARQQTIW